MTLLEIINEDLGANFSSIGEALEQYSARELLSGWLNYEGISGYTDKLLGVMDDLGFFPAVHEDPRQPVNKRAERRRRDAAGTKESPNNQAAPYKPGDIIAERRRWVKQTETKEAQQGPKAESALRLDSFEQINTIDFGKRFYLQRVNDLLAQIDRLRYLDAHDDSELQMAISKAVFDAYHAFDQIIYSR